MSISAASSLISASKQVTISAGTTIVVAGILGECLNALIFLSLRTFRQNSCAFYLTIMSILNIGELSADLLPRIMLAIYNTDGTESSIFYCKFRLYFIHICTLLSLTCFCLATIDQYCATCCRPRLQQLCNIKFARRLIILFTFVWIIHGIPYLVFFKHIVSPVTNKVICTMTDPTYLQYRIHVIVLGLFGIVPISITVLFGSLAYRNTQQMPYYTVPLVRRELEKQFTVMVLWQVVINVCTLLPYTIVNVLQLYMKSTDNPLLQAQVQLRSTVTLLVYYIYYANPFYIYVCASERFRRQLIYVLFKVHLNRCKQQPKIMINQVTPHF